MALFLLGIALFFSVHILSAVGRDARAGLIARFGEGGYKGLYSLAALGGLALIYLGWPTADATPLYTTPYAVRHLVYLLMLVSLIVLMSGYLPKGKIAAAVKHPMLAAIKIWAFSHLLVNGEVRSVILFGAFLAYAVIDRISVKRRAAPTPAAGPIANDAIAVGAGTAAWAAIFFLLHPYLAGVALS